jgi:hypothetical protein
MRRRRKGGDERKIKKGRREIKNGSKNETIEVMEGEEESKKEEEEKRGRKMV